jgi:hypothetical protein
VDHHITGIHIFDGQINSVSFLIIADKRFKIANGFGFLVLGHLD